MTNTEEITKLKKRVKVLEEIEASSMHPHWLDVLAKEYVIPGIKAAVKEHVDELERRGKK